MNFISSNEFVEVANQPLLGDDKGNRTLSIVDPHAHADYLNYEHARESWDNETIIGLLDTARTSGHLINRLVLFWLR